MYRGWGSHTTFLLSMRFLMILILHAYRHKLRSAFKYVTIPGVQIYLLTPWYPFPSSFTPITHKILPNLLNPFFQRGHLAGSADYVMTERRGSAFYSFVLVTQYRKLRFFNIILPHLFSHTCILFRHISAWIIKWRKHRETSDKRNTWSRPIIHYSSKINFPANLRYFTPKVG